MLILIVAIIALGCVAAITYKLSGTDDKPSIAHGHDCSSCDGSNRKCEQECMMEASVRPVEYYDDEELDCFRDRPAGEYADDEAEQFREILYTMRPDEVAGWNRSLALRGISLPNQVRDEVSLFLE